MESILLQKNQKSFYKKLLAWYRKDGRHDMPWRKSKDPYAVFVSEYMLQQTTVGTVRPYYDRFLKKFPTVKSLATGDLNDVLALWSGLGYYARARNLWAAMKTINRDLGGKIPSDLEQLLKLPGVGAYTAGAISTLAFNKPAPVLDGNIIRVMVRVLALEDDPKLKAIQAILKKTALELNAISLKGKPKGRFVKGGPKDLTLALMDLGATLCLPKNPNCKACPVQSFCLAKQYGRQENIPPKGEKLERPTVRRLFGVVQHQGKVLIGQRPKEGLFGGLWEFIGFDVPPGVQPVEYLEETLNKELGIKVQVKEALLTFEHQLSHRVMVIRSFLCAPAKKGGGIGRLAKSALDYERFRWVSLPGLKKLGLSSITSRILNKIGR